MVQIKLSIAFVLAAAAIAPVVALPVGDATPSYPREYTEEFQVRDSVADQVASEQKVLAKLEAEAKVYQKKMQDSVAMTRCS